MVSCLQSKRELMNAVVAHRLTSEVINTEAQLRALIGEPAPLTCAKISNRLNPATSLFIERSPFICIATSDPAGNCDLSPRGDPNGFVRILDERTLLIPERPGNKLADSLRNMLATMPTGGEVHRAIQGEHFDAQQYDKERAERYSRRAGFY
jgi:predicted pyridoxine 5'-phosphate oxidase superfamily flavin-nucleotide-binding protein